MPQYLAPGVYVEETTFRSGTIEGVSTSTAAFVGPTRYGPTYGTPTLLTSLSDFEAIYGSIDPLYFDDQSGTSMVNYVAQAVRSFFDNGGSSLYVSRTYYPDPGGNAGFAQAQVISSASLPQTVTWRARYQGRAGNLTLTVTFAFSQNVLSQPPSGAPAVKGVNPYDLVWISPAATPSNNPGVGGSFYWAESYLNTTTGAQSWRFHPQSDLTGNTFTDVASLAGHEVRVLTASLQITYPDLVPRTDFYPGLTFDPRSSSSFSQTFAAVLNDSYYALTRPIIFSFSDSSLPAGIEIAQLLLAQVDIPSVIQGKKLGQYTAVLSGGLDGDRPIPDQFEGDLVPGIKSGLLALEDVLDVSIVAAPGSTYQANTNQTSYADALQITNQLIAHCEKMLYRIAVLDSPDNMAVSDISAWRGQIDSSYAALYYPWVRILDPVTNQEANMPPSGFVCGIYARSDNEVGVHKAPANEVVTDALGFEFLLNKAQQDLLNPQGINAFRFFPGRGYRLWGARTTTSDVLNQYVNVRRYMNYLKKSIDLGTQSVVFENNGPALWASVTQLVTDFLTDEFRNGRLFGTSPAEAFFVRCDLTTMTQVDLDTGRMVCLIGVALLKPAEFVIFRIGQWTANSQL